MPVLRSSRNSSLHSSLPERSSHNIQPKSFTTEDFKREYDKIISNISSRDIKACLKSSSSEANFYSDICKEELKKLEEEKHGLVKKIQIESEINKKKDLEAARIVKRLWEEAHKGGARRGKSNKDGLKPDDVKKVWAEAKKLSNLSKVKKKKLLMQKTSLDTKIQLAREAIRFCQKFSDGAKK